MAELRFFQNRNNLLWNRYPNLVFPLWYLLGLYTFIEYLGISTSHYLPHLLATTDLKGDIIIPIVQRRRFRLRESKLLLNVLR